GAGGGEDEREAAGGADTRHDTSRGTGLGSYIDAARAARVRSAAARGMSDTEDIQRFYEAGLEGGRLLAGPGHIELARTQDVLERHLPAPPARVLDVGGGTGVYTRCSAGRNSEAHLVDLSPRHIEEARAHPGPALGGARVGDARRLEDA